ncbi:hypothetical protein [Reyranella sp.]|uniref:hypothetical protein n=1 Tax=Reyranella sp. TaxID=1929291 RepID=UPI003D0F7F48
MTSPYADIRRRLAEATGPLDDIAAHVLSSATFPPFSHEWYLLDAALRGSIDAALALVEEKLPGWSWSVDTMTVPPGDWSKLKRLPLAKLAEPVVTEFGFAIGQRAYEQAATPALAVLAALFAALEAQHG